MLHRRSARVRLLVRAGRCRIIRVLTTGGNHVTRSSALIPSFLPLPAAAVQQSILYLGGEVGVATPGSPAYFGTNATKFGAGGVSLVYSVLLSRYNDKRGLDAQNPLLLVYFTGQLQQQ